jgi:hypothetical protein
MTKKITPESLAELPVMVDTVTSAGLSVADSEPNNWTRSNALEQAIAFHKNNGGMYQANQVVATAQVFLDFIIGETK